MKGRGMQFHISNVLLSGTSMNANVSYKNNSKKLLHAYTEKKIRALLQSSASQDSCQNQNHSTVIHYKLPKGWVIANAGKVKAKKIDLKVYSRICPVSLFVSFCSQVNKRGIQTNGSSYFLTSTLHGNSKMAVLYRQKLAEFAIRRDHQKCDSLTIFNDQTSKKVIS